MERLRKAVLVFFRSEQQEAALRVALDDAGALFRDAPEAVAFFTVIRGRMNAFFEQALPDVPAEPRAFAAELVLTSMAALAEKVTERGLGRAQVDAWAKSSADMYCTYLESLALAAKQKSNAGARVDRAGDDRGASDRPRKAPNRSPSDSTQPARASAASAQTSGFRAQALVARAE